MDETKSTLWNYLEEGMRDLMRGSYYLLEQEREHLKQPGRLPLHDYSFVVFPAAKAYEGFLKKLFLDLKLITRRQYEGDRFRIGRALNPNLPIRYRWDWVYGRLVDYCQGGKLADELWRVWQDSRNRIFHFFPGHARFVDFKEAERLVVGIENVMLSALKGCRLDPTTSANQADFAGQAGKSRAY